MRKFALTTAAALAAVSAPALALWTIDGANGFVGKGDVQLALGWNNKALQLGAESVRFTVESTTVTEVSWFCTNSNNQNTQERARTTTTSIQGVVSSVARERNQITGFNLTGYQGTPTSTGSTFEGPPVNSCPSGPWSLTTSAGAPEIVEDLNGTKLFANGVELDPLARY